MDKQNNKVEVRLNINMRCSINTPAGEVATWLNSMNRRDVKEKVENALVMIYLAYAKEGSQASQSEIERNFWEVRDLISKHLFYQSQILKIKQPQWQLGELSYVPASSNCHPSQQKLEVSIEQAKIQNHDTDESLENSKSIYGEIDDVF